MVIEGTILTQAGEKEPGERTKGSPLASILADMLRSALAWEEEHGNPPGNAEHRPERRQL